MLAYHNLFNKAGHLYAGKIEPATMPMFTGNSNMTGFSSSSIAVGKHTYGMSSSRWGAGFNYVRDPIDVEISWSAGGSNMLQAADFTTMPGIDKAFHYKVAYASPNKPYEVGVYGISGGNVLSTANLDRYNANGVYAQRDPVNLVPGVIVFYQVGSDSNTSATKGTLAPASSHAYGVGLYESLFNGDVMLGFQPVEFTNNGLGTIKHFGNFDIGLHDPHIPYLYATLESAFAASSNAPKGQPTWRFSVKWAGPLRGPFKQ